MSFYDTEEEIIEKFTEEYKGSCGLFLKEIFLTSGLAAYDYKQYRLMYLRKSQWKAMELF